MNALLLSILRATTIHKPADDGGHGQGQLYLDQTLEMVHAAAPGCLIPLLSILNTVPGIVFIGMLVILIGMTPATVIVALSIYAMFPVLKNTVTGLNGVDVPSTRARMAAGMAPWRMRALLLELTPL